MEHYYEEPTDYKGETYQTREACLADLSNCKFSYSDGVAWQDHWDGGKGQFPHMVKIIFRFKDEEKEREFVVNIPISP